MIHESWKNFPQLHRFQILLLTVGDTTWPIISLPFYPLPLFLLSILLVTEAGAGQLQLPT